MHENFADWYQPVTFGHDSEILELRWTGVEEALGDLQWDTTLDLIRLVFGRKLNDSSSVESFREYFKDADPTFKTTGNDQEIITLASCVLALNCIDDEHADTMVALAILTTSACSLRSCLCAIDLVGMANERVEKESSNARVRPDITAIKKIINEQDFDTAIAPLEKAADIPHAKEAITQLSKTTQIHIEAIQDNVLASLN